MSNHTTWSRKCQISSVGLDFELRKKFKGMTFLYLYELSEKGN